MISSVEDCGVCVTVSVGSVDVSHGNWILLF